MFQTISDIFGNTNTAEERGRVRAMSKSGNIVIEPEKESYYQLNDLRSHKFGDSGFSVDPFDALWLFAGDDAETPILVTHINKEHRSLTFVTSDRQTGYLKKTPKGMKLNGCYMVKFAELNIKRPSETISFREASAEEARTAGLMVTATGKLSLALGGFGFVRNGSDDIFVPQKIAENSGNGDSVTVNAVLSYNHKRQSWGFTAISLRRDE